MARQMKDSGIAWIGEIPEGWSVCRIKDVATIYNGNSIKDDEKVNYEDPVDAIPYIATKDIDVSSHIIEYNNGMYVKRSNESFKKAPANSTLMCIEGGSAGRKIAITNQEVCFINKLCCFYSNNLNKRFLFHFLCSPSFSEEFKQHISGLIGGVSISEIKNFAILRPSYAEQKRISDFLDRKCAEIDAVIERTKATIEEYKKLKQAVITEAVTKGVRGARKMKDSGIEWIGEIPEEWEVRKLGRFIDLRSGITLGKSYPKGTELIKMPYLRVANVKADGFALEDVATIEVTADEAEKYALKAGELLMTEGGDRDKLGRGTIWHGEITPCLHQNHVFAATCDEKWLLTQYLAYLTASNVGRQYFDITAKKTTNLACTNSNTILQFKIPLPNISEQQEIIEWLPVRCEELDTLITKKTVLLTELETYKKSLIYEYVTGKKVVE